MADQLQVVGAPPLDQVVDDFLTAVRARGGSPRTIEHYQDVLRRIFLSWCAEAGINRLDQLDQRVLDQLGGDLLARTTAAGRPLSRASVGSYSRVVRRFMRWSTSAGLAAKDLRVQQPRVERKVLDTLTRSEINMLEAACDTERDRLIIRVLGDAGLRLGELLALRAQDLVEEGARERYLKVRGKGSRERLVPIKPQLYQRLARHAAAMRRREGIYADRLFVSLRRNSVSGTYEQLDARAVQSMLRSIAAKAGITKPINPHSFRHSMITNSLRSGYNPILLAKVVGHRDLTMIQSVYEHLVASDQHREMMRVLALDDE